MTRNGPLDLYIFHKGAECVHPVIHLQEMCSTTRSLLTLSCRVVAPSINCWAECIPISKQEMACKKSGKIEGVGMVEMYPTIPVTDAIRKELEAQSDRGCGRRLVVGGRPVPFGGP